MALIAQNVEVPIEKLQIAHVQLDIMMMNSMKNAKNVLVMNVPKVIIALYAIIIYNYLNVPVIDN